MLNVKLHFANQGKQKNFPGEVFRINFSSFQVIFEKMGISVSFSKNFSKFCQFLDRFCIVFNYIPSKLCLTLIVVTIIWLNLNLCTHLFLVSLQLVASTVVVLIIWCGIGQLLYTVLNCCRCCCYCYCCTFLCLMTCALSLLMP